MGIRVDKEALLSQLEKAGCPERAQLPFQKAIIEEKLPYTIGGGIGQSRICMFFLRKAHIGEVQCSLWPEEIMAEAESHGIHFCRPYFYDKKALTGTHCRRGFFKLQFQEAAKNGS